MYVLTVDCRTHYLTVEFLLSL